MRDGERDSRVGAGPWKMIRVPRGEVPVSRINPVPRVIYRFFDDPSHADALVAGRVWLSTLEWCRRCEEPERGDSGEGTQIYQSGTVSGTGADPHLQEVARRLGVINSSPDAGRVLIRDVTGVRRLSDAWAFCATLKFDPEALRSFGPYCVRIDGPEQFFVLVTEALGSTFDVNEGALGSVTYAQREYAGLAAPAGPIGFVKAPDVYAPQREYRMLWVPGSREPIQRTEVFCPAVRGLAARIS
jgi:hypothetical protein